MFSLLPAVTRALLIGNGIGFVLQLYLGEGFTERFALQPPGPLFAPYQIVTYAFLHGSFSHLFFNMLAVFMFGGPLEQLWGQRRFLLFYFASVLGAAAAQLVVTEMTGTPYYTVGASGGVFGLLFAFALNFPRQRIILLFPPIPMPAWLFVTLYGIAELAFGLTNTLPGIAHFAHLGGLVGGALVILFWRLQGSPTARPF
jgi:membrane associated rhomboid family serine protease